jgi:hypothetical protein
MRVIMSAVAAMAILVAGDASAQGVNLSGRWQCVAQCLGPVGTFAYITQYGWELNMVTEGGEPSRAWVNYPGRIWVDRANEGAIYSSDGSTLQFDHGTVWQRAPELPPAPPPPVRRKY